MTNIRDDVVWAAFNRAYLSNYINCNNLDERHELRKLTIFTNESLTKDEKLLAIKLLNEDYDHIKILSNEGTKKNLRNCQEECLATLYCEHCVRNYLKENFSNWTSGTSDIDNLIQKCQIKAFNPNMIENPSYVKFGK
ncbi:unnamed protein product [Rhizophagus irregularis]|nr:unnamed protein product [Rhizophagus irregularis]